MTARKLLLAAGVAAGAFTLMAPEAQAQYFGSGYGYPYGGYRVYSRPYVGYRPYYRYRSYYAYRPYYGYYRPYYYRPAYYGYYGPSYYGGPSFSIGFGVGSGW